MGGSIHNTNVFIHPETGVESARADVSGVTAEENVTTITAQLGGDVGGFYIRSIYLIDIDSNIIAAAPFPETYKPLGAEGGATLLTVNAKLNMANVEEGVEVISEDAEGSVRYDIAMTLDPGQQAQARANIGLDQVDNTSDADKPVSAAAQTALDAKANLSGGNAFSDSQTFSGQISLTGQAANSATDAATCGFVITLPPWLRTGDKWDRGIAGVPWQLPIGGTTNSSYYKFQLGPLGFFNNSAAGGVTAGSVGMSASYSGAAILTSVATGSANTGGVGAYFTTSCRTPANALFAATPCAKKCQVARVVLPTAANRAGRIYALTGGYIFNGAAETQPGDVMLRINGSSNALEARVCTTYPSTFAATQTTTGALASPASGTFTAWSISDSTLDLLIRRTHSGTALTVEIAPYHATSPTWTTVLSMTVGNTDLSGSGSAQSDGCPFCLYVQPDGSATGAAGALNNSMAIKEVWQAGR
jgi:hypothetical protein